MRRAFEGIVDYAGLFPPASCTMVDALRQYEQYRRSGDRWMLGRFVVAASRLEEMGAALQDGAARPEASDPWRVSAVMGVHLADELDRIDRFRSAWETRGVIVDAVECKAGSVAEVMAYAERIPSAWLRFFEVPAQGPYGPIVGAIGRAHAFAKIRTGGTTAELFPAPAQLTAFLAACVAHGVAFKATAGLHHPFRGTHPLTYDPGSATHLMFGFVNLLVAVAELARSGDEARAGRIVAEEDPAAFDRSDDAIAWRGTRYDGAELADVHQRFFLGFGSCSFREPIDELGLGVPA